ncbi:hypothetical protein J3R83DRAFT_10273 [Lanmaoa asiatica]|nr:hypothetical protein J3R83DRAFT_10273 [Lanmaoa asiatica]
MQTSIRNVMSITSLRLARNLAWNAFLRPGPIHRPSPSPSEEDAKAAILEKVMKSRLPSDLMLRFIRRHLGSRRNRIGLGAVQSISGQFKRSDLCNEHRLNPRDLRKIDSRIPNLVPTILIRKEAILINILHIRALVKADTVVLFDPYGSDDSRLHSVFLYHLEHNLKARGSGAPYEFRAIESILLSVLSALEAEMVFIRNLVGGLLAELEDDINHDKFKRLLHYSRRLAAFKNRATLIFWNRVGLDDRYSPLLTSRTDEDLSAMYLTDKKNGSPRDMHEHDELEVLLEFFSKQVEEIVNEAENIETNVQSTQEIVELILDSNRNALLALDLKVSIGTMGLGSGALVAGLFGMNLQSHMEDMPYAFAAMSVASSAIAALVAWVGFWRLAKIRKVGLTNPHANKRGTAADSKPRAPWIPLPLRRRNPDGWS